MPLPTFLVIGAYKAGTTSLHEYLRQHPAIFVPDRKEPNFFAFDENPRPNPRIAKQSVTTLDAYEDLFRGAAPSMPAGEVSPEYLVNSWAPRRIALRIPDAKLIAVLRNPVDRAFSDYVMHVRDGFETCSTFAAALDAQSERQAKGEIAGSYIRSGLYGEQLQRYCDLFPAEQLRVFLFDDFASDPVSVMNDFFRYLGVAEVAAHMQLEQHNLSGVPRTERNARVLRAAKRFSSRYGGRVPVSLRSRAKLMLYRNLDRPKLDVEDRARALEFFRSDLLHLQELLKRDLSHWLTPVA